MLACNRQGSIGTVSMPNRPLNLRYLNRQPYEPIWRQMQQFTSQRQATTPDEIWVLEHDPVFTLGQAGKPEHLLHTGTTQVIQVDRGGQVTWHGPGQLVIYLLLDLRRLGYGVRDLINLIENSLIAYLASIDIAAHARPDAPGVYLSQGPQAGAKIAALGLKIRQGCSLHGLSFNLSCDLSPFNHINPCGYAGMQVARLQDLAPEISFAQAQADLLHQLLQRLGHTSITQLNQQESL